MSDEQTQFDDLIVLPQETVDELIENHEVTLTQEEENQLIDMLSIAKKEKEIDFFGHTATIRTLTTEEEIELGRILQDYQALPTRSRAYNAVVVAASLFSVDGEVMHYPLSPNEKVIVGIKRKFDVVKEWSPSLVDFIFQATEDLADEAKTVWSKLGKI